MRDSGISSATSDLVRVVCVLPWVEYARIRLGPRPAVVAMREMGKRRAGRSQSGRAQLQQIVRWVDALFPRGRNCYRRVLLETALDAGAASESVLLGFRQGGGPGSGHAWLASSLEGAGYDCVISV